MAKVLTKLELYKRIAEMGELADYMVNENDRVCEQCLALHTEDKDGKPRQKCYCDYDCD